MPGDDFVFEYGVWDVDLESRDLATDRWDVMRGTSTVTPMYDGRANVRELDLEGPNGQMRTMSLRLYDRGSGEWRVHSIDIDEGVVRPIWAGRFSNGIGEFFNQVSRNEGSVFLRVHFADITEESFTLTRWFSMDGARSWEVDRRAAFRRRQ